MKGDMILLGSMGLSMVAVPLAVLLWAGAPLAPLSPTLPPAVAASASSRVGSCSSVAVRVVFTATVRPLVKKKSHGKRMPTGKGPPATPSPHQTAGSEAEESRMSRLT